MTHFLDRMDYELSKMMDNPNHFIAKNTDEAFGALVVLVLLDLIGIGICSIVNNIRYRQLLNEYASDAEISRVKETAIPRKNKKTRAAYHTGAASGRPRKKSHAGVIAAIIAGVVLLGLAAFILPQAAMPRTGGASRSKGKQTAKQPSESIVQILDYTIYEGTFVPVTSHMETGGPRVELQIKGSYSKRHKQLHLQF